MRKIVAHPEKCTGCGTCELVCSKAYFKAEDREKSSIRVSTLPDGSRKIDVCDQCGDCASFCSIVAITQAPNGVYRADKKKCVSCGICVVECVKGHMYYSYEDHYVFKCVACGLCVKKCPAGALELVES